MARREGADRLDFSERWEYSEKWSSDMACTPDLLDIVSLANPGLISAAFLLFGHFLGLVDLGQKSGLFCGQDEGQNGQDGRVKDEDDGQNIGPTKAAYANVVTPWSESADPLYCVTVPAVRVDHAPQEHEDSSEDLEPSTDLEDGGSVEEKEEEKADDAQQEQQGCNPHEDRSCLKRCISDAGEIQEVPSAAVVW